MADFDAHDMTPEQLLQQAQQQVQQLQHANQQLHHQAQQANIQAQFLMGQQNQNFQNQFYPPQQAPQLAPRPNLNLPQPKEFHGDPAELRTFKFKLVQFLRGNYNTYFDDQSQVMYAGSLLQGAAQQWLETLIDPHTANLPPHYTLDLFLAELSAFFGGGVTLAAKEHLLDDLRQTGSVSDFAIAFRNIINSYPDGWNDSAAIFVFSRKLKGDVRGEMGRRGAAPTNLQAYIVAAIGAEQWLADNKPRSSQQQQQQHQQQQQPQRQQNPNPGRHALLPPQNPAAGAGPMDLDGSRGIRGPLNYEERRRRADNNLCAYCGQSGHLIANCPGASRSRQARGTHPGFFPPNHGAFPSPWMVIPNPYGQLGNSPPVVPKNDPPSQ